ncbi:MAG: hypothetical protein ACK56I_06665, partial [bacterium]
VARIDGGELLEQRAVALPDQDLLLGVEQAAQAARVADALVVVPRLAELLGDDRLGDLRPLERVLGAEHAVEAHGLAQALAEQLQRELGADHLGREVERRVAQQEVVALAGEARVVVGVADLLALAFLGRGALQLALLE